MLQQADQRLLELQLRNAHNISVEFRTLAELHSSSMVDEAGRLWLRSSREEEECSSNKLVSLVYYRAGYTPADYPTEIEVMSLYVNAFYLSVYPYDHVCSGRSGLCWRNQARSSVRLWVINWPVRKLSKQRSVSLEFWSPSVIAGVKRGTMQRVLHCC